MKIRCTAFLFLLLAFCKSCDWPKVETTFSKKISFSILEDYDKGTDLKEIEKDLLLFKELGVNTWRGSFGWDDYEPERGEFDFKWLKQFIVLAASYRINLRPYIGYTPEWAAKNGGSDQDFWNNPPADLQDWREFILQLTSSIGSYPNILSFEIYNEENAKSWWDGSHAEYVNVLNSAINAFRSAGWKKGILLGGMTYPDLNWLEQTCLEAHIDIIPFHAYPETWADKNLTVENYMDQGSQDYFEKEFLPSSRESCGEKRIWINEMGFPTTPGKHTEIDQANWWARAIATYAATPEIEHLGIYEIKEPPRNEDVIGEQENYFLGITYADRKKKLAFHTLRTIIRLLNTGMITVADAKLELQVESGNKGELYAHYFIRHDGTQVLFVWDKTESPTVKITLPKPAKNITEHFLDGRSARLNNNNFSALKIVPGQVRIFEIQ